jgi:hypothetical protein
LVVVWTGRHGRGAGGTADAVRLAVEHDVPVLWVETGASVRLRLIRPEHLDEDFGFQEFIEELTTAQPPLVQAADPATLRAAFADLGLTAAPGGAAESAAPVRTARAYRIFRRLLGGGAPQSPENPPPEDLQAQAGFASLSLAYAAADGAANRLGALHRSHQVILLGLAILGAVAGSVSAVWPASLSGMVTLELALAFGALMIWRGSERDLRHQRWGAARRLAEDLRLERCAWALGVATGPQGGHLAPVEAAKRSRRLAGLPVGCYSPARVAAWGGWALTELVVSQAAYHRGQGVLNSRISHRVHGVENLSFVILMALLVAYLITSVIMGASGVETPNWLGGLVAMAGTVVPAIGAAGLALEATLSLGEEGQRSARLAARLEELAATLPPRPPLEALQRVAKAAMRLQRIQEDHWTEGAVRRRLVRGS